MIGQTCFFKYFLVISVIVHIPAIGIDATKRQPSENGLKDKQLSKTSIKEGVRALECSCGQDGICEFDEFGKKVCVCDYGFAENFLGVCRACDCNEGSTRVPGINCTFYGMRKKCICPPGFETRSEYCKDINECYPNNPCPVNILCHNKPGTFECRCKDGFEPTFSSLDPKLSGCEDINECLELPCKFPTTECVNSPGSYDCACRDGYYSTSGNYGSTYKPAYNNCYENATLWREATISLGVILSVGIIWISCRIRSLKNGF